jgi:hypothetical protein
MIVQLINKHGALHKNAIGIVDMPAKYTLFVWRYFGFPKKDDETMTICSVLLFQSVICHIFSMQ